VLQSAIRTSAGRRSVPLCILPCMVGNTGIALPVVAKREGVGVSMMNDPSLS
jgi:hypothetical protein